MVKQNRTSAPQVDFLPDGRRLHLNHGPIDLIVECFGSPGEVNRAHEAAVERFRNLLTELVAELPILRQPIVGAVSGLRGSIARRMTAAVAPYALDEGLYVTPMAAVAGAVADEMLSVICRSSGLDKAYVNNGGDIAVHLEAGESFEIGLVTSTIHPQVYGKVKIDRADDIGGIATSGRHGRSFSMGIADSVTVLATDAAAADAGATMIANAVDLSGQKNIKRVPAGELDPDSDLQDRLVVVDVGALANFEVETAIGNGVTRAGRWKSKHYFAGCGVES